MSSFVVAYDLYASGQKYECLREKLESYGTYWHVQQSVWIITSTASAEQILDHLRPCLDGNDKLFVAALTGEAAWVGYDAKISSWLHSCL